MKISFATLAAVVFLFTSMAVSGQAVSDKPSASPEITTIEFEKSSHDFGTVSEGGLITHEFKFTNKGKNPLVIVNVRPSCGCTTPGWPKEPIAPGKSAVITAQYNTVNRPGPFNKTLTVQANTEPAMTVLTISGTVVPKVKTIDELYPKKTGSIRMFSDFVYLGKISTKEPVVKDLVFYNDGNTPVTLSTRDVPAHMELSFHPATIAPKEKSTIKITYNALKRNELGPVEDKVTIHTSQSSDNKVVLHVVADINEYYPPLAPADAANAPKLVLKTTSVDFGKIAPQASASSEIEITNTGKQDLVLKKVRSGAPYITVAPQNTVIKAGETGKIKAMYKSQGKSGEDLQYIWIHSNDPSMPTQSITVKANVSK